MKRTPRFWFIGSVVVMIAAVGGILLLARIQPLPESHAATDCPSAYRVFLPRQEEFLESAVSVHLGLWNHSPGDRSDFPTSSSLLFGPFVTAAGQVSIAPTDCGSDVLVTSGCSERRFRSNSQWIIFGPVWESNASTIGLFAVDGTTPGVWEELRVSMRTWEATDYRILAVRLNLETGKVGRVATLYRVVN